MSLIEERCDHNRLAEQLTERLRTEAQAAPATNTFANQRVTEIEAFERRASGETPPRKNKCAETPTAPRRPPTSQPTGAIKMSGLKLLRPAEVTSAYLKMGVMGFQGSGKTKTAALTAIGLVHHAKKIGLPYADKPAAFLDTETGSDWVIPDFEAAGIELAAAKTRSFADLLAAIDEASRECSVLIIDSATHFWKELCDSYCRRRAADLKKHTYRLQFQDWAYLKSEWAKFTDRFINAPLHMIVCGRAGFEYDYFEEDDGSKTLEKTGMKMKAEGEFGFEPSLLLQMELKQRIEGKAIAEVWREAHVVKDRSTMIDGKTFRDPTFTDFLPHVARLNLGGRHVGVDTSRTSEHAITTEKRDLGPVQRKIVLGEIADLMVLHIPGQAAADKKRKVELIRKHFGAGWVEVEEVMRLSDLRAGYDSLHMELEGVPSRYGTAIAKDAEPAVIDDSLPDHSKAPAPVTAAAAAA